jgi:CPA1 family monovalent cation:H+ antiporter
LKFPILRSLRSRALGPAFLPFAPAIEIEPDIALALFVAPVLLDAAFDTSPRDLNAMRCRSLRWQSSR